MCTSCGGICAIVDRMIAEYRRQVTQEAESSHRRYFHPTEASGMSGGEDTTSLAKLVEEAACIGMTPQELENQLKHDSGFAEPVAAWIQERQVPNGMVRKIILTNAERIIREYGAKPQLTLLETA